MIKVGLTGGIGSGKTTVAKLFEVLGVPVFYADDEAKKMMNNDAVLQQKIKQQFGNDIYLNNILNKKKLAQIVFANPQKLKRLNALVHPATIAAADNWMEQQTTPYAIKEAALIFESDAQKKLDYVIGVYAPKPLRIQRTMQRDGILQEDVIARMNKQMDENTKMKLCNFVIKNDEQQLLIPQVIVLHQQLLLLAK